MNVEETSEERESRIRREGVQAHRSATRPDTEADKLLRRMETERKIEW